LLLVLVSTIILGSECYGIYTKDRTEDTASNSFSIVACVTFEETHNLVSAPVELLVECEVITAVVVTGYNAV
jgi:hypothetical protein